MLAEIGEGLGETTNNVAEYTAVDRGAEAGALTWGRREVLAPERLQLLINQITGRYRVKTRPPAASAPRGSARLVDALRATSASSTCRGNATRSADRLANEGVDAWLAARRRSR